ncbi:MAG: HAD family hydrolase [Patescibacteria group bacterium]
MKKGIPTKIKTLFFDANEVIYYRAHAHLHFNAFLDNQRVPISAEGIKYEIVAHVFNDAMIGRVTKDELFYCILHTRGIKGQEPIKMGYEALLQDESNIVLYDGVVETLEKLKKLRYRVGIVTDTISATEEKLRWFRSKGLTIAWDAFSNSAETGVRKPHATAYQTALSQVGVLAEESVFVGHTAVELEGARAIGMATVAFHAELGANADYYCTHFTELLKMPFIRQDVS